MRTTQLLGSDPQFHVYEVLCTAPASPLSEPEMIGGFALVLPQRGRFMRQVEGIEHLVDNSTAYFELPGHEQRVGHPCDGGDICTVVTMTAEVLASAVDPSEIPMSPISPSAAVAFHHRAVLSASRRSDGPCASDHLVQLVTETLRVNRPNTLSARPEARLRQRRTVDAAREALADDPSMTLPALAASVGCSPHHLSRIFSLVAGSSVSRYRMELRMTLALERLDEGDENLAMVATQAGFSDHAHLTRVSRKLLGETPSSLRNAMRNGGKRA